MRLSCCSVEEVLSSVLAGCLHLFVSAIFTLKFLQLFNFSCSSSHFKFTVLAPHHKGADCEDESFCAGTYHLLLVKKYEYHFCGL